MKTTSELAFAGFSQGYGYALPGHVAAKQSIAFWKILLTALTILVALILSTNRESWQGALSKENFLEVVNQGRAKEGLRTLSANEALNRAASAKAHHMLENDYFAHTSPAGVEPWEFLRQEGFKYAFAGENLALNYTSPYELLADFLQSREHRENLLSPAFSQTGIAVVEGRYRGKSAVVVVQLFAAPAQIAAGAN